MKDNNLNQSGGIKLNIKNIKVKDLLMSIPKIPYRNINKSFREATRGEIILYLTKKGELEHIITKKGLIKEDLTITKEDFREMYLFFLMKEYGTVNN